MTSFFRFCAATRAAYVQNSKSIEGSRPNNDDANSSKITTQNLSAMWKALSDSQKWPYHVAHLRDCARYDTEKGLWIKRQAGNMFLVQKVGTTKIEKYK